jgi:uncharacterized OB-fold protein
MTDLIPLVDYLVLGDEPRLRVSTCVHCGANYFDRRNACAKCGHNDFDARLLNPQGIVTSFSIVHFAAPGVEVPFVSATVECGGVLVKANLLNVAPDPSALQLGMPVRLATRELSPDTDGRIAVTFGFEPMEALS